MKGGRSSRAAVALLAVGAALTASSAPTSARDPGAILHEPIAADAAEDEAMHAAAGEPGRGSGEASGGRSPAAPFRVTYAAMPAEPFQADRDTARPNVVRYDDAFTPSIAPYKRMFVFDAVRDDYALTVRQPDRAPLAVERPAAPGEQTFLCDLVVDRTRGGPIRIPSVGPGAHVVRARLSSGPRDVPFTLSHDGADNWFLEPAGGSVTARARLVMEVAIAPEALGGPLRDNPWPAMPPVPPLPRDVEEDAAQVLATLGVDRRMRPRDAIGALVRYFRGFTDSVAATPPHQSIYLDLALSKKGVCRHRAFAFLITAQGLGVPTRMVVNEAHAWVEVFDGGGWRRIDLGGAGDLADAGAMASDRPAYPPLADPFPWPDGARRGVDMIAAARALSGAGMEGAGGGNGARGDADDASGTAGGPAGSNRPGPGDDADDPLDAVGAIPSRGDDGAGPPRSPSTIDLRSLDSEIHRGSALHVRGSVSAAGETCPSVAVDLWLREIRTGRETRLGAAATDGHGAFGAAIVVARSLAAGDYEVVARTQGTARCGAGSN